jgi:hypothetical protein
MKLKRVIAFMATTKLRLECFTASQGLEPDAPEILEIRNLTLKQALSLVRSLATASLPVNQKEFDQSQ